MSVWLAALLVRLFPAPFRDELGDDVACLFTERWRDAHGKNGWRRRGSLVLDLIVSATREWRAARSTHSPSRRKRRLLMLGSDLKHLVRWLARSPAFTLSALVTLAAGIGATTAIFGVFHGVLLRPLPFEEPERLAFITREGDVSIPDGVDWRAESRAFESIGLFARAWDFDLTGVGDPEPVRATAAEPDFFAVLRVSPIAGRLFTAEENVPGGPHVIVVTERFWRTRLGGEQDAIGRTITLSGSPTTVIGVLPAHVDFLDDGVIGVVPIAVELPWAPGSRGTNNLDAIGRLRSGVPFEEARQELEAISTRLAELHPRTNRGKIVQPMPMTEFIVAGVRPTLRVVQGAVAVLLLIGAVNLAGLLLARLAARQRELAVRSALGAGRGRLARLLVMEGLVLAGIGGVLGMGLAALGLRYLTSVLPDSMPRTGTLALSGPVLLFALIITALAGWLCGGLPALRGARRPTSALGSARGSSERGRHRTLRVVVATEIALAVALLAAAGVLTKSFRHLTGQPLGFEPEGVLVASVTLPEARYGGDRDAQSRAYVAMVDRLRETPGITHAAYVTTLPLFRRGGIGNRVLFEGRPDITPESPTGARVRAVYGNYFQAMRIPIVRGRAFTEADRDDAAPVAIINEQFARAFWQDRDPIGSRIALRDWHEFTEGPVWMTIVGVAQDIKALSLAEGDEPAVYMPFLQRQVSWQRFGSLVARTDGAPAGFARQLEQAVWSVDPALALNELETLEARRRGSVARERFIASVLAVFAGAALLLVVQGLWGVVAYAVAERRREIGVRVALGATTPAVLQLIGREALLPLAGGAAAGLALAVAAGGLLGSLVFEISPADPVVLAGALAVIALVAAAASALPAWRATRIDPLEAMRAE